MSPPHRRAETNIIMNIQEGGEAGEEEKVKKILTQPIELLEPSGMKDIDENTRKEEEGKARGIRVQEALENRNMKDIEAIIQEKEGEKEITTGSGQPLEIMEFKILKDTAPNHALVGER